MQVLFFINLGSWRGGRGMSSIQDLANFAAGIASGKIQVVDLTQELSEDTPLLVLPEPFGQKAAFSRQEISRYAERGVAWHWNNFTVVEHTGTHFTAPVPWTSGTDIPNKSVEKERPRQ